MDNHYYMIKAKAKKLLNHTQPYYISLTALPNLAGVVIRYVTAILGLFMFMQVVTSSSTYYYTGSPYSSGNTAIFGIAIVVFFLLSPLIMAKSYLGKGADIKILEWYRAEKVTDNASGFKDSFAIFSQNRFFPYTLLGILIKLTKLIFMGISGLVASWLTLFIALIGSLDPSINFIATFIGASIFFIINSILDLFISQVYLVYYDLIVEKNPSFSNALIISIRLISSNLIRYIWLNLSFIGWNILDFFCLGLLRLVWLDAYIRMTYVGFYDYMKQKEGIG